ncbi:DsbA family protein [Streptomyces tricolor]|nr:DsbA family protein [Streptomyces tricolor]
MSDSSPRTDALVLDVWCELQCPDCRTALDDVRALRARYGDRLELRLRHFRWRSTSTPSPPLRPPRRRWSGGKGWPYVEAVLERVTELDREENPS